MTSQSAPRSEDRARERPSSSENAVRKPMGASSSEPSSLFSRKVPGKGIVDTDAARPAKDILDLNKIEFGNTVPFVQRFRLIDEISHTKAELEQKSLELKLLKLQNDTADITHPVHLTEKNSRLQSMNSHLEAILQETVLLKQRLVQPIRHQCLPVEANCHRYVSELLPMMVNFIEKLDSNLQLINSIPQVTKKVKLIENLVTRMVSEVLELKEAMEFIVRWREQQKTELESLESK